MSSTSSPAVFCIDTHNSLTNPSSSSERSLCCLEQYEDNPPQDAIKQAQAELAATKDVMVKSIDAVLSRGERIEILVDRTDEMSQQARAFRKRSTVLR